MSKGNRLARCIVWLSAGALAALHLVAGLEFFAESRAWAAPHAPLEISIVDFSFLPAVVTVPVGSQVRWTNTGGFGHTTTGDAAEWDSGTLASGAMFTQTFAAAGAFPYHCALHPSMMGTVVVVATPLTVCPSGCGYTSIQAAVNDAPAGATISVTADVFTESVAITKSLVLLGGFTDNTFAARNPPAALSTIAGNNLQSVVAMSGSLPSTIAVLLDGFRIRNGRGATSGGGIRATGTELTLLNSHVGPNSVTATATLTQAYGAGLYLDQGRARLVNNRFEANINACSGLYCPVELGGAVLISYSLPSIVSDNVFQSNTAWTGAGIAANATAVLLSGNRFRGGSGGYGAGFYGGGTQSSVLLSNTFELNYASNEGGALRIAGGTLLASGNVVSGNVSSRSAGAFMQTTMLSLTNNVFVNNRSTYVGPGALDLKSGANWLVNNTFVNNTMVYSDQAAVRLDGTNGFTLANNIFYGHATAITATSASAMPYLTHNAFYSNAVNIDGPAAYVLNGNLIGVNPAFRAAPLDIHLRPVSPLRDAGDPAYNPATDFEGDPRSSPPDIGADEATGVEVFLPMIVR